MTQVNLISRTVLALLAGTALASAAHAATLNGVSVFATAPTGASAPDSVAVGDGSVFVAYTGGTNGLGVGTSTVVRYSQTGAVQATYAIAGGDADGLKVNPATGVVYVLQNQDGNSTLSLINPVTNTVSGPLSYAPPYTYGPARASGFDDVAFLNGRVFIDPTNPKTGADPIVSILDNGNAPTGALTTTPVLTAGSVGGTLPDSDSLKSKPNGALVLTDGNGGRIVTIDNPGTAAQTTSALPVLLNGVHVDSLDDVLYPSATSGTLYVADGGNDRVLALSVSGLDPNVPFVSLDNANLLTTVDAGGNATPFLTAANDPLGALSGPAGLDFLPSAAVPEPAGLAALGAGLLLLAGRRRA